MNRSGERDPDFRPCLGGEPGWCGERAAWVVGPLGGLRRFACEAHAAGQEDREPLAEFLARVRVPGSAPPAERAGVLGLLLLRTLRAVAALDWDAGRMASVAELRKLLLREVLPLYAPQVWALPLAADEVRALIVHFKLPDHALVEPLALAARDLPDCTKPGCRCGGAAATLAALQGDRCAIFLRYTVDAGRAGISRGYVVAGQ